MPRMPEHTDQHIVVWKTHCCSLEGTGVEETGKHSHTHFCSQSISSQPAVRMRKSLLVYAFQIKPTPVSRTVNLAELVQAGEHSPKCEKHNLRLNQPIPALETVITVAVLRVCDAVSLWVGESIFFFICLGRCGLNKCLEWSTGAGVGVGVLLGKIRLPDQDVDLCSSGSWAWREIGVSPRFFLQ